MSEHILKNECDKLGDVVVEMTPKEYSKKRGVSPQYIHRLLVNEMVDLLPDIVEIKKYSRFYVLLVKVSN